MSDENKENRQLGNIVQKFSKLTPKYCNKWGEYMIILSLGTSRPVQFMKVNILEPYRKLDIFKN